MRSFVPRYLDLASQLGEILFGLIMVLAGTLTASFKVAEGKAGVRQLLLTAIGCNVACRSRNFRLVKGNGWLSPERACLKVEFVRQGQYAAQQFLEPKR